LKLKQLKEGERKMSQPPNLEEVKAFVRELSEKKEKEINAIDEKIAEDLLNELFPKGIQYHDGKDGNSPEA